MGVNAEQAHQLLAAGATWVGPPTKRRAGS
jgi:hypothetical protein